MKKITNILVILSVVTSFMLFIGCSSENVVNSGVEQNVEQNTVAEVGEGHPWTHGDWSWRVLYEARYALSEDNHDGTSDNSHNTSSTIYGDWNYVADDSFAHGRASAEAGGGAYVGTVGQSGDYYLSGECTYFVRLVLYRATYWNFNDHYATPNYGYGSMYSLNPKFGTMNLNPSNWQGGWVLRGNSHFAIAEQRAYVNGSWGWWIIDSNYVGTHRIGKHFFTDSQLSSGGYRGWKPVGASNNW